MSTRPPSRPAAPRARPAVWVPVAALALAGIAFGVAKWSSARAAATARTQLLADVDAVLAKVPVDSGELSRLTSLLQKLPDHAFAADLLAAQARIELARNRPERARELFLGVASRPDASGIEQALGARILLRLHEAGADPGSATATLRQAAAMATAGHAATNAPAELLAAWQANERLGQHDASRQVAAELAASHGASPEARFVRFAMAFDPAQGAAAVAAACEGLDPVPVEGAAMTVFAQLGANDVQGAVASAEAAVGRGAGVVVVRRAAAYAFHACVLASKTAEERARWLPRRDAQLQWVLTHVDDEALRKEASEMLAAK